MKTIDKKEALVAALRVIGEMQEQCGEDLEVLEDETVEVDAGWIFFYNSSEYVRTKDPLSRLAGNGPILVTRGGDIELIPSHISWSEYLARHK